MEWNLTEHSHSVSTWLRFEARLWHELHWFAAKAGTSWGASTPTLRTSTLALLYAPAEYCATRGVVQKQPHSSRGCRPQCFPSHHNRMFASYNQVDQLSVLGEIAPPALMREAATLVLGRRACQHDHLLHDVMENSTHAPKETSVLCPSTREGETLNTNKVGWVVGIHHNETAHVYTCPHHQTADRVWAYPDESGPD